MSLYQHTSTYSSAHAYANAYMEQVARGNTCHLLRRAFTVTVTVTAIVSISVTVIVIVTVTLTLNLTLTLHRRTRGQLEREGLEGGPVEEEGELILGEHPFLGVGDG